MNNHINTTVTDFVDSWLAQLRADRARRTGSAWINERESAQDRGTSAD